MWLSERKEIVKKRKGQKPRARLARMRTQSLAVRLIVPAALVVLVALLAALQYRWLTQVSDADRDRRQTSLRQRAEGFADDFDREIARLYLTCQTEGADVLANDPQTFGRHLDLWR